MREPCVAESDHTSKPGMLGTAIPADAPPVVEAVFSCCRDGSTAGTVGLYGPGGDQGKASTG